MSTDPLLALLASAADEEHVWSTHAMGKLTVRMKDTRGYKQIPMAPGDPELFFTGVRKAKKKGSEFIFEFKPVDERPFDVVEFTDLDVFKRLEGFEQHLNTALGYVHEDDTPRPTFAYVLARYRKRLLEAAQAKAAEVEELKAIAEAEAYDNNPLWGAFA